MYHFSIRKYVTQFLGYSMMINNFKMGRECRREGSARQGCRQGGREAVRQGCPPLYFPTTHRGPPLTLGLNAANCRKARCITSNAEATVRSLGIATTQSAQDTVCTLETNKKYKRKKCRISSLLISATAHMSAVWYVYRVRLVSSTLHIWNNHMFTW